MTLKSKKLVKFKNVSHGFFGKKGGVSNGIYSALNCGPGSNDKISNVKKNLKIVSKKFKVSPKNLILLKQTHSNKCHFILKRPSKKLVGDGLITTKKNLALGILTADCAPVLIYDKKLPMIAAIHVGWKGAFKNILKKCIKFMIKKGSKNQNISAVIGPSIFRENYEVKRNFMRKFLNLNSRNRKFFYFKKSRIFFNLKEFIKSQLRSLKVNNIDIINKDTFKNRTEFFSARRALKNKENDYGRNISIIMLK